MLDLLRALRRRRLTPAQQLLFGQLVMFTGIAAIFPVVPIYVAHRGGSPAFIALFVAGPMVANTLVQIPAGRLVDRVGRKPVLIGSRLVFAAASGLLFADAGPLWLLTVYRAVQGASGGAYVPALRSALADVTPADRRGEVYAQLQAVEMVGLLVGPFIGGALALWHDSAIFACSGIGVLLGITAMARFDETGLRRSSKQESPPVRGWWRDRGLIVPAIALAATGAMFSMYDVVWPQYLNVRGYSTLIIGVSESLYAIPILVLAGYAGRLSDRRNRRALVSASFILVALCSATYPLLRTILPILIVGGVESVAFVAIQPTLFATISETVPAAARGRAMGIGGLFEFGGSAMGAAVLGTLYGVGEWIPFRGGAAFCVLAALLCALMLPLKRGRAGPAPVPVAAVDLEAVR